MLGAYSTEAERQYYIQQALVLDPVRFARLSGFKPDAWQQRFLRSESIARFLNCSRQVGKSTTVAIGALHRATYYPDSLILILSPGERQSGELMRKVYATLEKSPDAPALVSKGMLQIEFVNGSRIVALPGSETTVRGYSAVDILIVDEASRVADELFLAIEPMLAVSGGELWTLSSPYGTRGWWYRQYKQQVVDIKEGRKPRWEYYEIPAPMCPRITPEFLAGQRLAMGDWWWKQEYFCTFLDAQSAAFGQAEVDDAFAEDIIPWSVAREDEILATDGELWIP